MGAEEVRGSDSLPMTVERVRSLVGRNRGERRASSQDKEKLTTC